MALIDFPSTADIVECVLEFRPTGQTRLRSIYDGSEQIITRGPGHFAGTITLGSTDKSSAAVRADIERFLVEINGFENTFRVPIQRESRSSLAAGANVRFNSSFINADGNVKLQSILGAGSFVFEFRVGDYLTIGGRLYMVVKTGNELQPAVPTTDTTINWESPYIVARTEDDSSQSIPSPLNADYGGPWVIPFREAI